MKFIDDMKLSKKMIGGFLIVTAIMIIVAFADTQHRCHQ